MHKLKVQSFHAFLLICCQLPAFSLSHSVNILPRLSFCTLHSVILLPNFMFLAFYICRLLLLPHGIRNFGTKSIREIWFVTSVPSSADSESEGHTKNLSLEGNCVLFCGLHIVAK